MSAPWRTISPEALEDLHLSSQTLVFFIFEETFYCLRLSIIRISRTSASWNDWLTPQTYGCTPVKLLWGAARCCRDGFAIHTCAACNMMATECSGSRRSITQGGIVKYETSNAKGDGLNIKTGSRNSIKQICLCSLFLCVEENIHGISSCGLADSADSKCIKNIKSINDG